MLPWDGSRKGVTISEFRERLLTPILRAINARSLAADRLHRLLLRFPWRIDFIEELPRAARSGQKSPSGSLTGMTMLLPAALTPPTGGMLPWLGPESNRYARPLGPDGTPAATGAASAAGMAGGRAGELMESGGVRYLLSTMLGVTNGRGNTVGGDHRRSPRRPWRPTARTARHHLLHDQLGRPHDDPQRRLSRGGGGAGGGGCEGRDRIGRSAAGRRRMSPG